MSQTLSSRLNKALKERGRHISLVARGASLCGNELRERALDFAAVLRASGVEKGDTVGILVDRSVSTVVAILAVLNLKCAYLPLELTSPERWQSNLLKVAGARLLIFPKEGSETASHLAPLLSLRVLAAGAQQDAFQPREGSAIEECEDARLAYVMGTSGTTGTPKAVPIRESSLLHYCDAFANCMGGQTVLADLKMASVTTLAADLGTDQRMTKIGLRCGRRRSNDPGRFLRAMWPFRLCASRVSTFVGGAFRQ